jgi:hypothetical protein
MSQAVAFAVVGEGALALPPFGPLSFAFVFAVVVV